MTNLIHNIAIAGHGTCGKTSLIEELLFRAKATARLGKVDDGSSILDYEADEKQRKFTIDAKVAHLEKSGHTLNLIDTPGYPDFVGSVIDAFTAADTALIAIDAAAGIRVNTRRVWLEAERAGIARMIIITRLDQEQARFDELLGQIQATFGKFCVPLFIPDQAGPGISKIENTLLTDESSSERAKKLHDQLVEAVVEVDEGLLGRYLAEEPISQEEIARVFLDAILKGKVVPVMCVSVAKDVGVRKTLETLATLTPHHAQANRRAMTTPKGEPVAENPVGEANDRFRARVFKVVIDPFVGKLSYMRIYSGTLAHNMGVQNISRDAKERVSTILRIQGKETQAVDHAGPGEIVAAPKLESVHIGDTLGDASLGSLFESPKHPVPMVKLAVEPKNRNDETKLATALKKLVESDSCFRIERIRQTHELVIAGRSTLHLEVMLARLRSRHDLELVTRMPKTSYLESITRNAESHYKHKKQTGGRGQFGEVYLRVGPRGENKDDYLEFENAIVGGVIPNQFVPAVEKGVREAMEQGILAHCPVVNCKVTLYDGSFHTVDSSEAAFKTAGREAFKIAFLEARPCLLEPIVNIEIHVPAQFMGEITGDLNSRRGRITKIDSIDSTQIIHATVPEAEIKAYSTELRSLTGGEGSYSVEFSHYEVVPGNVQNQVVEQLKKDYAAHQQATH